jgi:hypothetical protein
MHISPWLRHDPDGSFRDGGPIPAALLSGSFNPLHNGHTGLAAAAARRLNGAVAFELSVANVDKPELPPDEVRRRLAQFLGLAPIFVTRAPTFAEKARLFPGAVLVVGTDTAVRVLDPRYYDGDLGRRDAALAVIRAAGCRFLVGGRTTSEGAFVHLDHVEVPVAFRDLFEGLSEGEFRVDVSSTALRGG